MGGWGESACWEGWIVGGCGAMWRLGGRLGRLGGRLGRLGRRLGRLDGTVVEHTALCA